MEARADLLVVGAGAKAAGLATKVHAINGLGLGPIAMTVVEGTEAAASWLGRNGMTSGEEPLAVTPIKDVGFPYRSHKEFGEAGEAIDELVMGFSWQRYMVARRRYARWVDAGSPQVRHRDYGEYLQWVLSRATEGVTHVSGRVTRVALAEDGEGWEVEVSGADGPSLYGCGALVLTGPGVHRAFPHDQAIASRVFHCDSRRSEFARIPEGERCDVGVVGGGESALSCVMFLRGLRPDCRFTIYTPMLPMSRGESFLENRVFSDPDVIHWASLDERTRRDFVKHSDRGVFDPPSLERIAYDDRVRFALGRAEYVAATPDGERPRLRYESPDGPAESDHDYVVNCTGFDLLAQLRALFAPATREEIESRVGKLWEAPAGAEAPIGRALELRGMRPRVHIPGMAGLGQGPGFANLGALGLVANRVLEPLLAEREPQRERFEAPLPRPASAATPPDEVPLG
jgi:mycobactin lysine-N-oxygenase